MLNEASRIRFFLAVVLLVCLCLSIGSAWGASDADGGTAKKDDASSEAKFTVVPEPATLGVLLAGLLFLAGKRTGKKGQSRTSRS